MNIQVIAFDADDTLWINEPYFREAEEAFAKLLVDYLPEHSIKKELYATEIHNLTLYGYGIKGFTLSMIETALRLTNQQLPPSIIQSILDIGKGMLDRPVELMEGVSELLDELKNKYRLVVATKGDLLDQERKLIKSGLLSNFHHIEIMSDKQVKDYAKLIRHLDIAPDEFMMVGNSIKSDILPVLELGAHAIHVPYHITWIHEQVEEEITHPHFHHRTEITHIREILL
ncbi:MAG: HAD family hydrolase [Chitinophagia bacterium]|jgi:putative hydrolase of the HAD superfamily